MITTDADQVRAFVEGGIFEAGQRFGASKAIGFEKEGQLVAGFVYHNWHPHSGIMEVSGYSTCRDWVNRDFLRQIFHYPFFQCGCRAVVARHSEHNKRVIRIWKALGAEQTPIPDLRGPGEAEVVALLTREKWENSRFMR